jgi:hypothetical protein
MRQRRRSSTGNGAPANMPRQPGGGGGRNYPQPPTLHGTQGTPEGIETAPTPPPSTQRGGEPPPTRCVGRGSRRSSVTSTSCSPSISRTTPSGPVFASRSQALSPCNVTCAAGTGTPESTTLTARASPRSRITSPVSRTSGLSTSRNEVCPRGRAPPAPHHTRSWLPPARRSACGGARTRSEPTSRGVAGGTRRGRGRRPVGAVGALRAWSCGSGLSRCPAAHSRSAPHVRRAVPRSMERRGRGRRSEDLARPRSRCRARVLVGSSRVRAPDGSPHPRSLGRCQSPARESRTTPERRPP